MTAMAQAAGAPLSRLRRRIDTEEQWVADLLIRTRALRPELQDASSLRTLHEQPPGEKDRPAAHMPRGDRVDEARL